MPHETLQRVPLELIHTAPQVRESIGSERSLCGLMASMAAIGLQQPIRVRVDKDAFTVIDGHRRLEAARRLAWLDIPAIVVAETMDNSAITVRQLVANLQRLDLSDADRGRAFVRLMQESGWSAAEVARQTGVSQALISRLTAILTDPVLTGLVESGRLAASTAYALVRVQDSSERDRLLQQALNGGMTRDRIAAEAKSIGQPRRVRRGRSPRRLPVVFRLRDGLRVSVAGADLTVAAMIGCIGELFSRLTHANAAGLALADVVKSMPESDKESSHG